jgi:hypothetical protein
MNFDPPVFGPGTVVWVGVVLEGNQVMAAVGKDLVVGCAGFGATIPDALRDLAAVLEQEGVRLGPLAGEETSRLHLIKAPPPEE